MLLNEAKQILNESLTLLSYAAYKGIVNKLDIKRLMATNPKTKEDVDRWYRANRLRDEKVKTGFSAAFGGSSGAALGSALGGHTGAAIGSIGGTALGYISSKLLHRSNRKKSNLSYYKNARDKKHNELLQKAKEFNRD